MCAPSAWKTLKQYVVEGIWHIWLGYDHILFLLSLLLPAVLLRLGNHWEPAPSLKKSLLEVLKDIDLPRHTADRCHQLPGERSGRAEGSLGRWCLLRGRGLGALLAARRLLADQYRGSVQGDE